MQKKVWMAVVLIVVILAGIWVARRSIVWNLPDGYKGWATVKTNQPDCKASRRTFMVEVWIDATGRGCSSVPLPRGLTFNDYRYVKPDGSIQRLPASQIAFDVVVPDKHIRQLFIGSLSELDDSWQRKPRN